MEFLHVRRAARWAIGPWAAVLVVLAGITAPTQASTFHVDPSIASDCPTTYNPTTRSCSGGSASGYRTLSSGLGAATPGDIVSLRGGTYGQLAPSVSGTSGQPITIKAFTGETATITGSVVGLWIIGRSDLIIDGLTVSSASGFCRLEDSTRITLQNMTFQNSTGSGTTGGCKFVRSAHNRVLNNTIINGNDSFLLQDDSDRNLVTGNTFDTGRHSLVSIRCSSYNVFRNNTFENPIQKAVEIYDCAGVSDAPVRSDDARRNLFEQNKFIQTSATNEDNDYNAMQHGGQEAIVRRNEYRNNLGGGIYYQSYSSESLYVYKNRAYNNTFYANACYALIGDSESATRYYDNRMTNNLLYKNTTCSGGSTQTRIPDSSVVILTNNTLATSNPGFVSEAANDFRLTASSNQVDAGVFVTTTVGNGNGTSLRVADAGYFSDGFGIIGEIGDLIQLQGQSTRATILAIDYATGVITLNQALSWTDGQGVHLAYTGSAPDIGAYEKDLTSGSTPAAPRNLRLVD